MLVEGVLVAGAAIVLPAQDRQPPPGQLPEWGNSSPVGLVIVLLLLLATMFLIRSMSKRITRLPESFDPPADAATGDTAGSGDPGRTPSDPGGPADAPTDAGGPTRSG